MKQFLHVMASRRMCECLLCILMVLPWTSVSARETLRVGAFHFQPGIYQDPDGAIKGFFVDLLNEVARKQGWTIEYVYGSWADGLNRLQYGEVDVLTSVAYTEERDAFMDFGQEPILTVWSEVYVHSNSNMHNIFDLRDKRIAAMKGDFNAQVFRNHMIGFDIECDYVEMPDFNAVIRAIETKQVDAGIVNNTVGAAVNSSISVKSTDIVFNPFPIYFTVADGKNRDVISSLDYHLTSWKADPNSIYYRGLKDWMRRELNVKNITPSWLWQTLAALVVISGGFVLFNVILRRRVKQAVSRLRTSEESYRILFERASDAIFLIDKRTGQYLSANRAAEQLTGRSLSELKQMTTHEITPKGADKLLAKIATSNETLDLGEVVYLRPDDSRRTAQLEVIPLDENICFGIARDITERKQAENKLRLAHEKFLTILDTEL